MMQNKKCFDTKIKPTWCPGCGNFMLLTGLKQALVKVGMKPENTVIVTDVGCSGNVADFIKGYVIHALHGRAVPPAVGAKLANPDLNVIVMIGDGGCYAEGLQHFLSLMRGNHDITVLVHNNGLYSLTTGQAAPTTPKGAITKSTPEGAVEHALNPLALALSNNGSFVARAHVHKYKHMMEVFEAALKHKGFSYVDIFQPCVTFNRENAEEIKEKVVVIENEPNTKGEAWELANKKDQLPIGVFWQEKGSAYHEQKPGLKNKKEMNKEKVMKISGLLEEFK